MSNDDAALAAVSAIVRSLATDPTTPPILHPRPTDHVKLPGRESIAKTALERELSLLVLRIEHLESRANSATVSVFPDTPNETSESFYGEDAAPAAPAVTLHPAQPSAGGAPPPNRIGKALEGLRDHVDDQSKLLDTQRKELAGVNAQLIEQKELQEHAAKAEELRVQQLERELWKHQQANEAFQKALREIGEIVTAVARGDLSKKVRMNSVDMDPEITTFKRTINTMMDQLQVFASEVSRVAREVGTEGILGGQAQIEGVDGTWKELTDNGEQLRTHPFLFHLSLSFFFFFFFVRPLGAKGSPTDSDTVNIMAQNLTDQGKSTKPGIEHRRAPSLCIPLTSYLSPQCARLHPSPLL